MTSPSQKNEHLQYLLTAYVFDNLSAAGKVEVESHLQKCEQCRQALAELRLTLALAESAFDEGGKTYVFEERRRQRVMDAARASRYGLFPRMERKILKIAPWKLASAAALVMVLVVGGLLLTSSMMSARRVGKNSRIAARATTSAGGIGTGHASSGGDGRSKLSAMAGMYQQDQGNTDPGSDGGMVFSSAAPQPAGKELAAGDKPASYGLETFDVPGKSDWSDSNGRVVNVPNPHTRALGNNFPPPNIPAQTPPPVAAKPPATPQPGSDRDEMGFQVHAAEIDFDKNNTGFALPLAKNPPPPPTAAPPASLATGGVKATPVDDNVADQEKTVRRLATRPNISAPPDAKVAVEAELREKMAQKKGIDAKGSDPLLAITDNDAAPQEPQLPVAILGGKKPATASVPPTSGGQPAGKDGDMRATMERVQKLEADNAKLKGELHGRSRDRADVDRATAQSNAILGGDDGKARPLVMHGYFDISYQWNVQTDPTNQPSPAPTKKGENEFTELRTEIDQLRQSERSEKPGDKTSVDKVLESKYGPNAGAPQKDQPNPNAWRYATTGGGTAQGALAEGFGAQDGERFGRRADRQKGAGVDEARKELKNLNYAESAPVERPAQPEAKPELSDHFDAITFNVSPQGGTQPLAIDPAGPGGGVSGEEVEKKLGGKTARDFATLEKKKSAPAETPPSEPAATGLGVLAAGAERRTGKAPAPSPKVANPSREGLISDAFGIAQGAPETATPKAGYHLFSESKSEKKEPPPIVNFTTPAEPTPPVNGIFSTDDNSLVFPAAKKRYSGADDNNDGIIDGTTQLGDKSGGVSKDRAGPGQLGFNPPARGLAPADESARKSYYKNVAEGDRLPPVEKQKKVSPVVINEINYGENGKSVSRDRDNKSDFLALNTGPEPLAPIVPLESKEANLPALYDGFVVLAKPEKPAQNADRNDEWKNSNERQFTRGNFSRARTQPQKSAAAAAAQPQSTPANPSADTAKLDNYGNSAFGTVDFSNFKKEEDDSSKKVAIAAKDSDIRAKEAFIAQVNADKDKLEAANKQLAAQNGQLAGRNAQTDVLLDAQVKLATGKNAKDMSDVEFQAEKERVTQELTKLRGVVVKQQQAVVPNTHWEAVEEASISYAPIIQYPSNWDVPTPRNKERAEMEKDLDLAKQKLDAAAADRWFSQGRPLTGTATADGTNGNQVENRNALTLSIEDTNNNDYFVQLHDGRLTGGRNNVAAEGAQPFPGVTRGPERTLDSSLSQVGSVINNTVNFFNNNPETISGLDANGKSQGLDPNVLTGDFGDIRKLGDSSGMVKPAKDLAERLEEVARNFSSDIHVSRITQGAEKNDAKDTFKIEGQVPDQATLAAMLRVLDRGVGGNGKFEAIADDGGTLSSGGAQAANNKGGGLVSNIQGNIGVTQVLRNENSRLLSFVRSNDKAKLAAQAQVSQELTLRGFRVLREENPKLTLRDYAKRPVPPTPAPLTDEGLDEDEYINRYGIRPFVDASRDHLSTFSMDVDTASYTRARALLRDGKIPDAEAVRTEEFVNYFKQAYAVCTDEAFGVFAEGGPSPFGSSQNLELLKIGIKSRDPKPDERRAAVLTIVVDTSGSMGRGNSGGVGRSSGGGGVSAPTKSFEARVGRDAHTTIASDRLTLVKNALRKLVEQLRPEDAISIVTFGEKAELVLPRTQARQKQRILDAVHTLAPRGGTNVESGLNLGYRMADEAYSPDAVNRVILCSDGVANVGSRGPDEILKTVKVFAARGIDLVTVGFGMGEYNDEMMAKLADNGNGSSYFCDTQEEAEKIFKEQLPPHFNVLARDAKVQVDFDPKVVSRYRLLGYEKRKIADKDFRNDAIDAGEVAHSTLVTALYEIQRTPGAHGDFGKVYLRWKDATLRHLPVIERNFPISEGIFAGSLSRTTPEFRLLACVAEFAELLKGSRWSRDGSYALILAHLDRLPQSIQSRADVKELRELVGKAQELSVKAWMEK